MREIKIRAWDNEKMHYPETFEYSWNNWSGKPAISIPLPAGGFVSTSYLMESIGIKDVNQIEVYEQDIVEVSKYESDERYMVVVQDIRKLPIVLFGSSVNWIKVIGNTFENPNLNPLENQ